MLHPLRRHFYYSEALVSPDKVPAIIRASRANNTEYAITGALIYTGSRFGQLLEGPPAHVETLIENLHADPRHRGIQVCFDEGCDERWVSHWSMGYLTNIEFVQYVTQLGSEVTRGGAPYVETFRRLLLAAETL